RVPARCPAGGGSTEVLGPQKLEAAVDWLAFGGREKGGKVVASPAVSRREDFARRRLAQHPLQRGVSHAPEIGSHARPVEMHVGRQRGGRRTIGEPPLLTADIGERHSGTAELRGHRHLEINGPAELLEVLREESVLAIVPCRAITTAGNEIVGKSESLPCGRHRLSSMRILDGSGRATAIRPQSGMIDSDASSACPAASMSRESRDLLPRVANFGLGCPEEDTR